MAPEGTDEQVVIEGPSGDPVVLTAPAFRLHVFSLAASFARGVPGFIPDAYLDALDVESTAATAELCRHGLWTRRDGGYDVQDRLLVEAAAHVQLPRSDVYGTAVTRRPTATSAQMLHPTAA